MTDAPIQPELLAMFQEEVQQRTAGLMDSLMRFGSQMDRPGDLEPIVTAAHAIKGAAAVVGLQTVRQLAGALEHAAQTIVQQHCEPEETSIDLFIHTLQLLEQIAQSADEPGYLDDKNEEIIDLARALADESTNIEPVEPTDSCQIDDPAALLRELQAESDESDTCSPPDESDIKPPDRQPAETLPETDPALMALFLDELQTQNEILAATRNPADITRALHGIQSAARLIGLIPAAELTKTAEQCMQQNGIDFTDAPWSDLISLLNELLSSLSDDQPIDPWLEQAATWTRQMQSHSRNQPPPTQSPTPPSPAPPPDDRQNNPSPPVDPALLALFREELSEHGQTMTDSLLALETDPRQTQAYQPLMRAAHSIKGAARVIGLDPAVTLAHAAEDLFVQAQSANVILNTPQINTALQIVDLLQAMAQSADQPRAMAELIPTAEQLIHALQHGDSPRPAPTDINRHRPDAKTQTTKPIDPEPPTDADTANAPSNSSTSNQQAVVKVTAANLNRLMALAGQSLVEAGRLQPFTNDLTALKSSLRQLTTTLDRLAERMADPTNTAVAQALLDTARSMSRNTTDTLVDRLADLEHHARRNDELSHRLYREVIASRMRPFADRIGGYRRMVRDLAQQLGKQVNLAIHGLTTEVDRDILEKLDAPLTHMLRNAVDHGIETPEQRVKAGKPEAGNLSLSAHHAAGMLHITLTDDGAGVDLAKVKQRAIERSMIDPTMAESLSDQEIMQFMFLPGFSTRNTVSEVSGRGVGLDVVHHMTRQVGGSLHPQTNPGRGTSVQLRLPITLSVVRALMVLIDDHLYAFPLAHTDRLYRVETDRIHHIEGRRYLELDGENIGLIDAARVLELTEPPPPPPQTTIVVIADDSHRYGLIVDQFIGERDLVVQPIDSRLGKVPDISAAAIDESGNPLLLIDVQDMIRSIELILTGGRLGRHHQQSNTKQTHDQPLRILVVDDSPTVRQVERKLLEDAGYTVATAVDGIDGLHALKQHSYDLVISDVDMPRMNGIEMVSRIKQDNQLAHLPVVIVSYKDTPEDRQRGLHAGANYYLTKSSFHDRSFIDAVQQLIGEPPSSDLPSSMT